MFTGTGHSRTTEKRLLCNLRLPDALDRILGDTARLACGERRSVAAIMWFDQKYFLPDDILNKVDRMSMAHAVEVRPPFLDHRIVEFAASLPCSFKISGSRQKFILKELMKGKLPAPVLSRKKMGFDIPAHEWLRGPLRSLLIETLAAGVSEHSGLFRSEEIETLLQRHLARTQKPWLSPLGTDDFVSLDAEMADPNGVNFRKRATSGGKSSYFLLAVVLFAGAVYLGCIVSPPSLMDDVDAVQAQIARNMLASGDWVTARLDGVPYLEKAPLVYWMMAASYRVFGVHDWAARIPIALSSIGLCLLTAAFGMWAFGKSAGFYAGLCMSTCVGLFLFTRILIPDVMLTFTVACALWAFLRTIDDEETHPDYWAFVMAANLGLGLLLKSLIGVVFPVGAALIYLLLTHQLFSRGIWKRLHPFQRAADRSANRGALACPGSAAESALSGLHAA